MNTYKADSWYWIVGKSQRVYSTAKKAYVALDDPAFSKWQSDPENYPLHSATEDDMIAALRIQCPAAWPALVPEAVTPLQMRKALRKAGLIDKVSSYVSTLDAGAKDAWEYASEVKRDNPIIAAGAAALSMTSEQVDDLFRLANTFE